MDLHNKHATRLQPPPPIPWSCDRNEPNIYSETRSDNSDGWHGSKVSVIIAGNWPYYRAKLLKYLRQIAVITPYAQVQGACGVAMKSITQQLSLRLLDWWSVASRHGLARTDVPMMWAVRW
jgi:hypothetical protein